MSLRFVGPLELAVASLTATRSPKVKDPLKDPNLVALKQLYWLAQEVSNAQALVVTHARVAEIKTRRLSDELIARIEIMEQHLGITWNCSDCCDEIGRNRTKCESCCDHEGLERGYSCLNCGTDGS